MEEESLIILKELRDTLASLKNNDNSRLRPVLNGVIVSIILLIIGFGIAFVKLPYSNAQDLKDHIKDDAARWNTVDERLIQINENFKALKPSLKENTYITPIRQINE